MHKPERELSSVERILTRLNSAMFVEMAGEPMKARWSI